jgi:hypothetical protein
MKYTQRIINQTMKHLLTQYNLSERDINFYNKQLELLVEAVTWDFKDTIQQININSKINLYEHNSNQNQATSTRSDGGIQSSSVSEKE